MVLTLEEMAAKGAKKFAIKAESMKTNYGRARGRMQTAFNAQPFTDTIKSNYSRMLDTMVQEYRVDGEKWKTNWVAKMSGH